MQILGPPRAFRRINFQDLHELGPKAKERLRWVSAWQALVNQGLTATEASQTLGLSRSTLYRWYKRLHRHGPKGMKDGDLSPRRRRTPTWSPELAQQVCLLREHYPQWGKDKLVVLLRR